MPVVSEADDWREFRAKLVASSSYGTEEVEGMKGVNEAMKEEKRWAHVLARPERGSVLLANPLMFTTSQTYFNKAVILIFSHGEEGSAGIILNKPTQHTMSDFKAGSSLPDEFDACRLYLGGDVGPDVVNLLHGVEGAQDSSKISSGVYLGGLERVRQALSSGEVHTNDVKLLTRYAGWGRGQLEEEVRRGVWIVAAPSRGVVLDSNTTGDEKWHEILQLMGGEYSALSEAVKEEYRADIMEYKEQESVGDAEYKENSAASAENKGRDGSHYDDFGDYTHGSGI